MTLSYVYARLGQQESTAQNSPSVLLLYNSQFHFADKMKIIPYMQNVWRIL